MSKSEVVLFKSATLKTFDRGGGARTSPLVSRDAGATAFMTGYTQFEAGAKIPFHYHDTEESVVLIDGEAVFEVLGKQYSLSRGDATFIPANVQHRFRNASNTESLTILWIYGSTCATRTLVESGETRPITLEHVAAGPPDGVRSVEGLDGRNDEQQ